jgi:hypothetical protein
VVVLQFLEGGVRSLVEGAMGPTKQALTDLKAQIGKVRELLALSIKEKHSLEKNRVHHLAGISRKQGLEVET